MLVVQRRVISHPSGRPADEEGTACGLTESHTVCGLSLQGEGLAYEPRQLLPDDCHLWREHPCRLDVFGSEGAITGREYGLGFVSAVTALLAVIFERRQS